MGELPIEVFFSPNGGCTAAIINEIQQAKSSIKLQAYGYTSKPISEALISAKKKGIAVVLILDKSNLKQKTSLFNYVKKNGLHVLIDSSHSIAHNKIIIIDDESVITGSFNFTENAERRNAENLIIIRDKKTALLYIKNWNLHATHSKSY